MGRVLCTACVLAGLLAVSAPALADDAAEARRTTLFQDAKRLASEGRWAEASAGLREVIALRSAPKALIALALVERELVHHLEAKRLLEQAIVDAEAQKLDDDAAAAKKALSDLAPLVPRVSIRGAGGLSGVAVFVDDQPAVMEGGDVLMDPGTHVVRIEVSGRAPKRETVVVATEGRASIAIDATSASADVRPAPAATQAPDGPAVVAPIVVGGVGVAAAAVGVAMMALGAAQQSDAEDACGGTTACPIALQGDVDDGATKIIVGDVMVGVGGAAALTGVIWLVVELATSGSSAPASAARVVVEPRAGGLAIRF